MFSDFTLDLNENERSMGHAVKMLSPDKLAWWDKRRNSQRRPTVILVHHTGKKGSDPRGHSSITGAIDIGILVEKRENHDEIGRLKSSTLTITNPQNKNEDPFARFSLTLEKPAPEYPAPVMTGAELSLSALEGWTQRLGITANSQVTAVRAVVEHEREHGTDPDECLRAAGRYRSGSHDENAQGEGCASPKGLFDVSRGNPPSVSRLLRRPTRLAFVSASHRTRGALV